MWKNDLFERVITSVCEFSGLRRVEILESRREECVDARSVLIEVLCGYMSENEVAQFIGKDRRSVNYLKNGFRTRVRKWAVRMMLEEVKGGLDLPITCQ